MESWSTYLEQLHKKIKHSRTKSAGNISFSRIWSHRKTNLFHLFSGKDWMALCRDTSTQVEQIVAGNRRASSLYVALTMRRGRIRWPRTIKDFCESSPFRLWPNYLPDIAAMEKIRNRICHSHDHIHRRRFFSLFPFIDDQRRGLFDSNGMLLCKLVFCAKNARFFSPPGEMSRNLISAALLRKLK